MQMLGPREDSVEDEIKEKEEEKAKVVVVQIVQKEKGKVEVMAEPRSDVGDHERKDQNDRSRERVDTQTIRKAAKFTQAKYLLTGVT